MTKVQIDDYECPICHKIGLGELDMKTGRYICCMCGKEEDEEENLYEIRMMNEKIKSPPRER